MALVQNFTTYDTNPNQVNLSWTQPLGFNTSNSQIIVTKTSSYFPMELYNAAFPKSVTDPIPVEIFRGQVIVGTNTGTISVAGKVLTDTSATFPTNPPLNGRILRDSSSNIFKILSNTTTSVTLDGTPVNGQYVILADFPTVISPQQTFERDIRTTAGPGTISNLVQFINGALTVVTFIPDSLANLFFQDGAGNKFIVSTNTANTLTFFESTIPVINVGMSILSSSTNNRTIQYVDNFSNYAEAAARIGTGLLSDHFYYYTAFDLPIGADVAQADFATWNSPQSTQSVAISTANNEFGNILYNYWPTVEQQLDTTGDLFDVMQVFGYQFQELHSYINTYNLQDSDNVYVTALAALADQTGLPSVGYSIGIDTLRRIARNMIAAWELKGSKQGIALFIRILTTWDITGGTGDINDAISDLLPNISAFRFYSNSLGTTNTRFSKDVYSITNLNGPGNPTLTEGGFTPGGRFVKGLPGIIIPGFFTFREFVVTLPNVALLIGKTTAFSVSNGTTTITDSTAPFGSNNSLVGNFILPNEAEPNDIYQIISNTSTTVTVSGIVNDRTTQNTYVILSPLNTNRFIILVKFMPLYQPYGTLSGFSFVNT